MGKSSPSSPSPEQVAASTQKSYQGILDLYPQLFGMEQLYGPQQVSQGLSNLSSALYGTPAGSRTVTTQTPVSGYTNRRTGQFVTDLTNVGNRQRDQWTPFTQMQNQTQTVNTPASEGLLSLYGRTMPQVNQWNADSRAATYDSLRSMNPGQASLYDLLNSTTRDQLAAGDRLTPQQTWQATQGVRSNWADRGLGNAPLAGLDESLQLFGGGQNLLNQRIKNANDTAQLGSQLYDLPSLMYSPQTSVSDVLGLGGSYGHTPSIAGQLGLSGSDTFGTMWNTDATQRINAANANNAAVSNGAQIAGSLAMAGIIA